MIGSVLEFLRKHLDAHLTAQAGVRDPRPDPAAETDRVVFVDGEQADAQQFKANAVTLVLVNLEQERTLRAPELHVRVSPEGGRQRVRPDIRLNLYVLFVARFKVYSDAWDELGRIVQFLQSHAVVDRTSAPDLPAELEQLSVELVTLDFAGQNEVWNALRTAVQPSLLYRVQLIVFRDESVSATGSIAEISQTAEVLR